MYIFKEDDNGYQQQYQLQQQKKNWSLLIQSVCLGYTSNFGHLFAIIGYFAVN